MAMVLLWFVVMMDSDDAEEKLAKTMASVACSNVCWNGAGIPLEMMQGDGSVG
jgi:hypothetical protein